MLRKARKVIPRDTCLTLFNTMVLPLFDYCCVVWDACGQDNKNFLDRLYRRAASITEGRNVTQDELGTVSKWRSLQRRRDYTINACRFTNASIALRQCTFLTTLKI